MRHIFPRYPPEWETHPDVVNRRLHAIEDHLEDHETKHHSNSKSPDGWLPTAALLAAYLLGGLGLVSPEKIEQLAKLLGH